ncbi:FAD-dependent monooxygenase [Govanella unica]|uniref:FAD-dependent monooxygenase n=1 Tax=Govanella unica TaxID=2975056 RepID=A0A9X3TVT2_9PROT|nr:FAD-dependent monooxygenase [Govania unica]MDA5192459.1 FAD-dependent monooxygenase [Govania unica]
MTDSSTRPDFPFRRPPELDGPVTRQPVVIAGGGPVGLTLALELARRKVPSLVLEADKTVAEGSRAICFSRRTVEILDALGAADGVMAMALPWLHGRSYYRNHEVYKLTMPHGENDKFFPMVNLQQYSLELALIDRVLAEPLIDLRWQNRVTAVTQQDDHVTLEVETPAGSYRLEADWLVAADGARSTVRRQLNLPLQGQSYEGRYLIADIHMPSSSPTERRAWFDPPSNPGATILMHKQPGDIWRIDYQLNDDEDEAAELAPARIHARVAEHLAFIKETAPWTLVWASVYKAHCLCLDNYVQNRVIFAGDAAHLVPIFGVRGLNSGIADANNLGWKLSAVIDGQAPAALLASYNSERRAATFEVFEMAGKSTVFMTPPSRGYSLMREAALQLAVHHDFTRPLINPRQSTPFRYDAATDDPAFEAGPRPGALYENRHLPDGGFLSDKLGRDFTLLLFGDGPAPARPDLTVIRLTDATSRALYDAAADSAYLLRPDNHVAARFKHLGDPAVLLTAIAHALGQGDKS